MASFCFIAALLLCTVGAYCQECAGRPPMQQEDCCENNNLPPQQAECMQRLSEQWKALHQSGNKESSPQTFMCASNCFFNNTNVFTSDNKLNSEETKIVLEKFLGTEWQALLPSIIETCKEHLDKFNANGFKGPKANCDMGKERLFYCLHEQFMTNCPDSIWKNSAECNEVRSYLKNCPFEKRILSRQQ